MTRCRPGSVSARAGARLRMHEFSRAHPRTLWVRTASSPSLGFGHLRRTLTLARRLRPAVKPIFLLDPEDRWSQKQVTRSWMQYVDFHAAKPWPECRPPDALLVDTRQEHGIPGLVCEARRRGIPVVSIHDLGLMPIASDTVIDGSILPLGDGFPLGGAECFCGSSYLVLNSDFARFRNRLRPIRRTLRRIVINLGGGDMRRHFLTILSGLRAAGLNLEAIGIPGFADWGQEELGQADWTPVRFRWAPRSASVARLLWCTDLAITAGGLAAYEALCAGAPLCAMSCDRFQQITVTALARAHVCMDLGPGEVLRSDHLANQVLQLAGSPEVRRGLSQEGRGIVDGLGARRVTQILRRIICGHPATRQRKGVL